jgi:hypothetical protein
MNTQAANGLAAGQQRASWLKTLLQWHWISSALCLIGMMLFSITGFTLNHSSQLEAKPRVHSQKALVPKPVLEQLRQVAAKNDGGKAPLPAFGARWLRDTWNIGPASAPAEWTADEMYLPLPRPGGDAWVRIALLDGAAEYELTDRGWVSWLNDLHKGRNSGVAWSWFIDLFAVACLVFTATGFLILKMHAHTRPITWPLVGFGLLLPALIALLFIH